MSDAGGRRARADDVARRSTRRCTRGDGARPGVFVIGEDIAAIGGLFQVTAGLLEQVRAAARDRRADLGGGAGGRRASAPRSSAAAPSWSCRSPTSSRLVMDQVVNHAAKWRYMSGGKVTVPFVLRGAVSSGIGMAAQHSQTLEAWFVHAPGLVVIMPSTPYDAKGLLTSGDPRRQSRRLPGEAPALQPARGGARGRVHRADRRRRREARGNAMSPSPATRRASTSRCRPARQVARAGIELEVVDLRTLKPLDIETARRSVQQDGPARRRHRGRPRRQLRERGRRPRRSTRSTTRSARRPCA